MYLKLWWETELSNFCTESLDRYTVETFPHVPLALCL